MKVYDTSVGKWYRLGRYNLLAVPSDKPDVYVFLYKPDSFYTVTEYGHLCGLDFEYLPNCNGYDYQPPAPEPVYRPFANAAEFRDKYSLWFRAKNWDRYVATQVIAFDNKTVSFIEGREVFQFNYQHMLDHYVFDDGTPFGILETKDAAS